MNRDPSFSHLDAEGRVRMVDVSSKPVTRRKVLEAFRRFLHEPERLAERRPARLAVTCSEESGEFRLVRDLRALTLIDLCRVVPMGLPVLPREEGPGI